MRSLIKVNDDLFNRSFSIFDELFAPVRAQTGQANFRVEQDAERYYLQAVVPGYEEKDLNLSVEGNTLVVSGHREKRCNDKGIYSDISSFEQSWAMPHDVLVEQISAEYKAGILTISLPRQGPTATETRQIPIKALNP